MQRCLTLLVVVHALCMRAATAQDIPASSADLDYFERKIRPLLVERCYECHSAESKIVQGGLRLDSAAALSQGGDSGPVLVPGKPEESLLIQAIRYGGDVQMPPEGKLAEGEIEELVRWVQRGAPLPPDRDQATTAPRTIDYEAGRKFWSFQAVQEHPLPEVKLAAWPHTRLDYFVLSAMEREGLQPGAEADRATLIRRLYFDLVGLPPSPEAVREFVADESSDAYARLVEQLLQSPHYGEKWGRMWLDLARYTDTIESWLSMEGEAHLYRDWVVQAFNDDVPYNEFVQRQLATDLLPDADPRDLAALGFLGLSPTYWKELKLPCEVIKVIVADEWEERVDAVSSTFLGLTVACARCHDHKFDPISSEDYYALAGVFASCRLKERPLVAEQLYEPVREAKAEIAKLNEEIKKLKADIDKRDQASRQANASTGPPEPGAVDAAIGTGNASIDLTLEQQVEQRSARIAALKATPLFETALANGVTEESLSVERAGATPQDGTRLDYHPGPQDLPLYVRGDPNRPGPIVPRRFLKVLSADPQPFVNGSGRLELAQAITTDAAPLAARVFVNRIWLAHFGQGLVDTPSNFGAQGGRPTHPELLDDLAARFIAHGWSIKWLHREILLSATWRQTSLPSPAALEVDPGNKSLSHMNRRRLEFEPWRDAMLSASGLLDLTLGGHSLPIDDPGGHRRTLYCTVHREDLSMTFQIHDVPDPNQHSPQRTATTTPLQGLFALNGPLLVEQARALVRRLQADRPDNDAAQIERAYWLLYSRAPTEREVQLGRSYLIGPSQEELAAQWEQYAHVLLAANELLFVD